MQCSAVQFSTVQYNTVLCSLVQFSAVQCDAVWCIVVLFIEQRLGAQGVAVLDLGLARERVA